MTPVGRWPAGLAVWLILLSALAPATALAAGPKARVSTSSAAAVTPTVPLNNGGLSGFPNPPVVTSSTTPTATAANTTTAGQGSSAFSSSTALVIVVAALVVIVAIALFIWRDARRRAPVREVTGSLDGNRAKPGSKAPPRPRKLSPAERRRRKRGRAKR